MKIRIVCQCGQDYELDKPRGRFNLSLLISNAQCPKCGRHRGERQLFEGQRTCAICPLPIFPRKSRHGLCFMHYQQLRRKGLIKVRPYHFKIVFVEAKVEAKSPAVNVTRLVEIATITP